MEKRIEKLEHGFAAIALELGIITATCATKSDLVELKSIIYEAKTTITLWAVAAVVLAQILPRLFDQCGFL